MNTREPEIRFLSDKLLWILLLCAFVAAIMLPWHLANHRMPIWDEASYVGTVQQIMERFDSGWRRGLHALYLVRNWRPIVFPAFAVPFFFVAQGNVLLGVALTQICALALITAYTFLILAESLSSIRASVGTVIVLTSPWLVNFSYMFFSEPLWMAATVGWVFHLLAGMARRPRVHLAAAGLWLGAMGATRPAETVLIALLPVLALLMRELVQRRIPWRDLALFAVQTLLLGAVVAARVQAANSGPLVWGLLAAWVIVTAVCIGRYTRQVPVLGLVVLAESVFMAWHFPALRNLYLWAYETSFGPMANLSVWARFADRSPGTVYRWFVDSFHPTSLACLGLIGALALCLSGRFDRLREIAAGPLKVVALSLLMLLPVLATLLISGTNDSRRVMPEILVLYIGVAGLASTSAAGLPRVRLGLTAALAALQTAMVLANGMNLKSPELVRIQSWLGPLRPAFVGVDDNVAVMDEINKLGISSGRISAYTLCYRDPTSGCTRRGIPWFEVEALTMVASQRHLPIYVNMARDLNFSQMDTLAFQLKKRNYNMVLIDTFAQPDQVIEGDPLFEHTFRLISMMDRPLPPGFKKIATLGFGGRPMVLLSIQ